MELWVVVVGMAATQKYHRGHLLITYASLDGGGWRRNRTNLFREGRLFVFTFHTHLLFLRNWDILTQLKSIATILNDLFCPKVYEMVGQGHEKAAKYTSVEKAVDRHKKTHGPRGILVVIPFSRMKSTAKTTKRLTWMAVFKIQSTTKCQLSWHSW